MRAQTGQLAVVQHQNHIRVADGAGPLRPPVSGTHIPREKYFAGLFFQKSPAGKNRKRMMGAARPMACAQIPPR